MTAIVDRLRAAGCVFAEQEAQLLSEAAGSPGELESLVARRIEGLPLEQLLGWVEFLGMRLAVGPGVFVPRKRTEFLARQAIERTRPGTVVVELCCGCAAIAAAVHAAVPEARVHAAELDPEAVRYARRNCARVHEGDLDEPLPGELAGRVGVLVANAPYVPSAEIAFMPPEAREHEPNRALDGGPDGLDIARRIAARAGHWLAPGGSLLIETSTRQSDALAESFTANGLEPVVLHDEERAATVVLGENR
ncbi:putative protein N(5)-glutamine methyltransferase [Sciscionella sediminilitoris]|uniref:putative protein N(5)-glutamine methyltransferase n=1 Tax=Sciscionella sediminilitoris TaxID=1445613 RepID=UPI0004DEED23|nr:putative protein N(5)-glutamine methyltransferase [Sciscionella sp. SE31]